MSRRTLLKAAGAVPLLSLATGATNRAPAVVRARPTDIRILEIDHQFEDFLYRAPYQFGGRSVDRVTLAERPLAACGRATAKRRVDSGR